MTAVCGLCLSVIGNESDEQSYIEKIRQEAIEEFRNGLLEEIIEKKLLSNSGMYRNGYEDAIEIIESYNLPIK